jgi:hypothetical protein
MVIGLLGIGFLVGTTAAGATILSGGGLLLGFLAYSLGGAGGTVVAAVVLMPGRTDSDGPDSDPMQQPCFACETSARSGAG